MPHYPVLQPDGHQWAVFSTIVDAFTMFDATLNEALDELENWHRLNREEQAAHLKRIMAGEAPDYPHWKTWNEAAALTMFFHPAHDDVRGYITERTPPEQMQIIDALVEKYEREDAD